MVTSAAEHLDCKQLAAAVWNVWLVQKQVKSVLRFAQREFDTTEQDDA